MRTLLFVCALSLLLALFDMHSYYYSFLRIFVTGVTIVTIYLKDVKRSYLWDVIFIAIAILFNPIAPIFLHHKVLWMPIDIISCSFFMAYIYRK